MASHTRMPVVGSVTGLHAEDCCSPTNLLPGSDFICFCSCDFYCCNPLAATVTLLMHTDLWMHPCVSFAQNSITVLDSMLTIPVKCGHLFPSILQSNSMTSSMQMLHIFICHAYSSFYTSPIQHVITKELVLSCTYMPTNDIVCITFNITCSIQKLEVLFTAICAYHSVVRHSEVHLSHIPCFLFLQIPPVHNSVFYLKKFIDSLITFETACTFFVLCRKVVLLCLHNCFTVLWKDGSQLTLNWHISKNINLFNYAHQNTWIVNGH